MTGKRSKLSLGLAMLILGGVLIVGQVSESVDVAGTFASEPVKVRDMQGNLNDNNIPTRIIIPSLSINLPIKKAEVVDGYWEVSADSANWGVGSGIPGEPGNQVIFAHATKGLFLPLKNIRNNMLVYVFTKDRWFEYRVVDIKEVYPDQVEVIAPTENQTLTLYTCSGFKDTKRLIVTAKPAS